MDYETYHSMPLEELYERALSVAGDDGVLGEYYRAVNSGVEDPVIVVTTNFRHRTATYSIGFHPRLDVATTLRDAMADQPTLAETFAADLNQPPRYGMITIVLQAPHGFYIAHEDPPEL